MRSTQSVPAGRSARWLNSSAALATGTAALIALTFALYYPALHTQLVADDFSLVGQISFAHAAQSFSKTFGFGRSEYRPVKALSYAVDRWLWGDWVEGYHLTNLILHAITAVLAFLALRHLTGDFTLSFLAAGVFIIHPVNHERATWISARDAPLCAVFLLGALCLHLRWRRRHNRVLHWVSIALAGCALLAYEAAVILAPLFFGVEFLFFADRPFVHRASVSLRATGPFWVLTGGYICVWQVLFSGTVGAYDLSLTPTAILRNYGRLLYALFYGHRRLAFGVAYLLLLAFGYRALVSRRRISVFALMLIIVSFAPFCFINGFAHRFAYLSTLGFAILFAACLVTAVPEVRRAHRLALVCIAIVLCSFYVVEVRRILNEWTEAAKICARITRQVREMYPNLPEGAVLVFMGIPHMHGRAYVFPTGLDAAVQREYAVVIHVQNYDGPRATIRNTAPKGAHLLEYAQDTSTLREILQ